MNLKYLIFIALGVGLVGFIIWILYDPIGAAEAVKAFGNWLGDTATSLSKFLNDLA